MCVWVFKYNTLPPNSLLPALLFDVRRRTARFSLNRKRFRQKTESSSCNRSESQSKSATLRRITQVVVGNVPPHLHLADNPCCYTPPPLSSPHPPPQLRINSPSWLRRSYRRNCMNIHTGLRFGQEDLDLEMVTGWGEGGGGGRGRGGVAGPPSAPHLGVATARCRRALGRLDPAR